MITSADIQEKVRAVPFQPFRIVTSSGSTYDIPHPDMICVTRRTLIVGVYDSETREVPDRTAQISMLHVSEVQMLPSDIMA